VRRPRTRPALRARSHPNVVRLYGYCLEPPTVCLILELLPGSLKDVLYRRVEVRQPALPSPTVLSSNPLASTSGGSDSVSIVHARLAGQQSASRLGAKVTAADGTVTSAKGLHHPAALGAKAAATVGNLATGDVEVGDQHSVMGAKGITAQDYGISAGADGSIGGYLSHLHTHMTGGDTSGGGGGSGGGAHGQQVVASRLVPKGDVSMLRVLEVATDVAAGLAYLHATPMLATAGAGLPGAGPSTVESASGLALSEGGAVLSPIASSTGAGAGAVVVSVSGSPDVTGQGHSSSRGAFSGGGASMAAPGGKHIKSARIVHRGASVACGSQRSALASIERLTFSSCLRRLLIARVRTSTIKRYF
jgi:hypothetical protein